MAANKPSIPKGTRDFSPEVMLRRNYIFNTIRKVYQKYAYLPIETPAMENLSTLMGKYGEEGDKLLFKVLNSGDWMKSIRHADITNADAAAMAPKVSEKGLRYDLTVPFARFVVQHQNDLVFPFKRYQIQPVWRADRPQRGRYREFYQCDADVIGSNSLLNEAELVQIINDVFHELDVRVCVKINNRKILAGIAEYIGEADKLIDITVAIDKLDKIGLEKVQQELVDRGLSPEKVELLQPVLDLSGDFENKIKQLADVLRDTEIGMKGIEEIHTLFNYLKNMDVSCQYELDLTLARGLNYYTGAIFEVKALDAAMGSICGGGRYDDLTGIFGLKGMSGVGISFGADRIYDVMEQLQLFPESEEGATQLMFVNFGAAEEAYCLPLLQKMRAAGINAEIFPDAAKMKKQMTYANRRNIPYVVLAGEEEIKEKKITLKDMHKGEQHRISIEEAIKIVKA